MGHSERLFADTGGLASDDVAQLTTDGLASSPSSELRPICGFVLRHGQATPFTLDISQHVPEPRGIMPEQIAIAALLMASFVGAIYHILG